MVFVKNQFLVAGGAVDINKLGKKTRRRKDMTQHPRFPHQGGGDMDDHPPVIVPRLSAETLELKLDQPKK